MSPGRAWLKTEGIALRIEPETNTSARAEWLSNDAGRFSTSMRGAYRRKSFLLGQFDLFYTCELVLQFTASGIPLLRECYPLEPRTSLRSNWRSAAAASYIASLFSHLLPWLAPAREEYLLLTRLLDSLTKQTAGRLWIYWAELKILNAAGLSPLLSPQPGPPSKTSKPFHIADGSRAHAGSSTDRRSQTVALSPDAEAVLRRLQQTSDFHTVSTLRLSPSQEATIGNLLGSFIAHHLELSSRPRRAAMETVGMKTFLSNETLYVHEKVHGHAVQQPACGN